MLTVRDGGAGEGEGRLQRVTALTAVVLCSALV